MALETLRPSRLPVPFFPLSLYSIHSLVSHFANLLSFSLQHAFLDFIARLADFNLIVSYSATYPTLPHVNALVARNPHPVKE